MKPVCLANLENGSLVNLKKVNNVIRFMNLVVLSPVFFPVVHIEIIRKL